MSENKKLEQNKPEQSSTLFGRALITGFVGGLLWSFFGVINYYFNFSEVAPRSFLLRSWLRAGWTDTWLGDLVSVILVGILSIGVALIYYMIFRKINSIWIGVGFGLVLWGLVYYLFQPIFPNIPNLTNLESNTIVSSICLFILYGIFVGFSISYDYHDTVMKDTVQSDDQSDKQLST
ncbi:Conserved membrane protein YqhR [Oceanobacillus limi]|uniref:Conserved membrane protein YqhR n=1 Tax=Oceanobacillus limi TaxID=930131 RepID=A0A1H9ZN27_9BACI|nr:YqhR family membrane protein [Oceanobacillus limi]SES83082.1 Conserved membrane protein YqhR [Oceanobacillus limi]